MDIRPIPVPLVQLVLIDIIIPRYKNPAGISE